MGLSVLQKVIHPAADALLRRAYSALPKETGILVNLGTGPNATGTGRSSRTGLPTGVAQ